MSTRGSIGSHRRRPAAATRSVEPIDGHDAVAAARGGIGSPLAETDGGSAATSINAVSDLWLAGRPAPTREAYRRALVDLRLLLGCETVDEVAPRLLASRTSGHAIAIAYRAALLEGAAASATVNLRLAALRSLVRHAHRLGLVDWLLDVDGVRCQAYRDTRGPGRDGLV